MYTPTKIRNALADGRTHEWVCFHFAVSPGYLQKLIGTTAPQRPQRRERGVLSFNEAAERYFIEVAPGAIKPDVATRYRSSLKQLPAWFPPLPVKDIDAWAIGDVVTERKKSGVTNATIKRDLTAVSRVLSACVAWGELSENVARNFDRSIIRERRDPIVLPTDAEIAAVVAVASPGAAALIQFLVGTGCRLTEAAQLQWSQVDLTAAQLKLHHTKNGRVRIVPLSPPVMELLQARPRHPKSPFVFWHGEGLVYREFSSTLTRLARLTGVRWSCHDLRHRFAVDFLQRGGNIYKLSKILGHGSVKVTEIYLDHLSPDEAMVAMHGNLVPVDHK